MRLLRETKAKLQDVPASLRFRGTACIQSTLVAPTGNPHTSILLLTYAYIIHSIFRLGRASESTYHPKWAMWIFPAITPELLSSKSRLARKQKAKRPTNAIFRIRHLSDAVSRVDSIQNTDRFGSRFTNKLFKDAKIGPAPRLE
jgi:hypothetical protein